MKKFLLAIPLVVACSCATLPKNIDTAFSVSKSVSQAGEQAFRQICQRIALACFQAQDSACEPLQQCRSYRDHFNDVMASVDGVLALAKAEQTSGNAERAKELFAEAQKRMEEARKILEAIMGLKK